MKRRITVIISGLVIFVFTPILHAEKLKIFTEEMPPYNYLGENNEATGFSTGIVKELLKRSGLGVADGKIKVYPWTRAYMILQKEKNVMLFSMTRSEEREKLFKWVGPIASRTIWFWKLKNRKDINVSSFDDAKQYKVGAVREFASARYMKELGFNLELCNSEEKNFRKLLAYRIDILTALELAAAYQMNKQGKSFMQLERLVKLDDRYDYYLALNISTSEEIINSLQNALEDMKNDGTYEKIKQLYLK
jgi:polar amino acid transport system substrate-binding protein